MHEEFINDAVAPQDCEYPWHFTVFEDGNYEAGPCETGEAPTRGRVTAAELEGLGRRADAVANQDLSGDVICAEAASIGSDRYDITRRAGDTVRFLDYSPSGLCHRGDEMLARELASNFHELLLKYYPSR